MPTNLRRLLNHLPLLHGGNGEIYVRASWHKPTPYDQCVSKPPFRMASFHSHYGRKLHYQQLFRRVIRWSVVLLGVWLAVESVRALVLL